MPYPICSVVAVFKMLIRILNPVSYTHLDVYKRQADNGAEPAAAASAAESTGDFSMSESETSEREETESSEEEEQQTREDADASASTEADVQEDVYKRQGKPIPRDKL